jgi:hypothetical protein
MLVLPNLDMRGTVECDFAAIVSPTDDRVQTLRADHPELMTFLSKFSGQFKNRVWPSLLLLKSDAPPPYRTAEAITAFRDIVSLSVVPYARSMRWLIVRFKCGQGGAESAGVRPNLQQVASAAA